MVIIIIMSICGGDRNTNPLLYPYVGPMTIVKQDGIIVLEVDFSDTYQMPPGDFSAGTFYIGNFVGLNRDCGGDIHGFTITDDPYSPSIPFGLDRGPIQVNKMYKDKNLLIPGTDYDMEIG